MVGVDLRDADAGSSSRMDERIAGQDEHDPCRRHRVEPSEHAEDESDAGRGDAQHDLTEDDHLGVVLLSEVQVHPRRPRARCRRPTGCCEDDDDAAQDRQSLSTAVVRNERCDCCTDAEGRGRQQQPADRRLVSTQRPQRGEQQTPDRRDRDDVVEGVGFLPMQGSAVDAVEARSQGDGEEEHLGDQKFPNPGVLPIGSRPQGGEDADRIVLPRRTGSGRSNAKQGRAMR